MTSSESRETSSCRNQPPSKARRPPHRRAPFFEQDQLLAEVFARYRVARCCIDQTGMGEKPVEDAQRAHGTSRVEGVLFTAPNKLTLATLGKEAFEDRRIRIPLGDRDLRADLHKLQKVSGPTGTPRFVADSDSAGHADRTWAGFLALNAAAGPHLPPAGTTIAGDSRAAYAPQSRPEAQGRGPLVPRPVHVRVLPRRPL